MRLASTSCQMPIWVDTGFCIKCRHNAYVEVLGCGLAMLLSTDFPLQNGLVITAEDRYCFVHAEDSLAAGASQKSQQSSSPVDSTFHM